VHVTRFGLALLFTCAVALGAWAATARAVDIEVIGPSDGAALGSPALTDLFFEVAVSRPQLLPAVRLAVNGDDRTTELELAGDRVHWRPNDLGDGEHEVVLTLQRGVPYGLWSTSRTFSIDTRPPRLEVTAPAQPVWEARPVAVAGRVAGADAVVVDGIEVPVRAGRFTHVLAEPPKAPVEISAADALGNTVRTTVRIETVPVPVPPPEYGDIRAVHVTPWAWVTPSLRDPVLEMIEQGLINTVQLDLKDESGMVPYDSAVALAHESGAVRRVYDLHEAVATLHDLGVRVIGRIVAFRDPILAAWAWDHGHRDMVLQRPDGTPYAGYGGFTNFANPTVRAYNVDLAEEAAAAGMDDILWDYIRRPDGPLENLLVPGLQGTPEAAIVSFFAESRVRVAAHGAEHGASVYGIASTRPRQIAQDIPGLAAHADYIAPMVYPSHWAAGEYDVDHPNAQPYDIVRRSLDDFLAAVEGTDTRIVPWLQDFSLGVAYGPEEVRAQIDATFDAGITEFILWNPRVRYTAEALHDLPPWN
jgi:hypothetical protein